MQRKDTNNSVWSKMISSYYNCMRWIRHITLLQDKVKGIFYFFYPMSYNNNFECRTKWAYQAKQIQKKCFSPIEIRWNEKENVPNCRRNCFFCKKYRIWLSCILVLGISYTTIRHAISDYTSYISRNFFYLSTKNLTLNHNFCLWVIYVIENKRNANCKSWFEMSRMKRKTKRF